MAITVRELVTKLTVDSQGHDNALGKAGKAMKGLAAGAAIAVAAVAAVGAAIGVMVSEVTAQNDAMAKSARAIGVNAQELQKMAFAAERSGIQFDQLVDGVKTLNSKLLESAKAGGKGGIADTLSNLGIQMDQLDGATMSEKLGIIADGLLIIEDPAMRAATAATIFGEEAGSKFATLINEGSEGIAKLGAEAESLGKVLGDDALGASEAFQDSLTNFKSVLDGIKKSIVTDILPILQPFIDMLSDALKANQDIIKLKIGKFFDGLARSIKVAVKFGTSMYDRFELIFSVLDDLMTLLGAAIDVWMEWTSANEDGSTSLLGWIKVVGDALNPMQLLSDVMGGMADNIREVDNAAKKAALSLSKFRGSKGLNAREASGLAKELAEGAATGKISARALNLLSKGSEDQILELNRATGNLLEKLPRAQFTAALDVLGKAVGTAIDTSIDREFDAKDSKRERARKARDARTLAGLERDQNTGAKKKKSKKKKAPLTDAELLKLIDIAATGNRTLDGLIGSRSIQGTTPPSILVKVIRNEINQTISAPVTVNGASSAIVEELGELVLNEFEGVMGASVGAALERIQPLVAR